MPFVVAAFYTLNTPYEQEVKSLIRSLDEFGLEYDIRGVDSRGDWVGNAAMKPEIILNIMQSNPGKNILYVDADAIIRQYPILFDDFKGDIGVHYRKDRGGHELLSGTIFVKNIAPVTTLISKWVYEQSLQPKTFDQKVLASVIKKHGRKVIVEDLPPSYTQIFDSMKHFGQPVIEHFQASRRFKNQITSQINTGIPKKINGMNTRICNDGSFFLPRASRRLLKLLENDFVKMSGELRFYPKFRGRTKYFESIRYLFKDKECYIVGKGPSLDHITADLFKNKDWPILCTNEAIHTVEGLGLSNPTFAVQQDHGLRNTCAPRYADIFVSHRACSHYKDFENKFVYYPENYQCGRTTLTVLVAMAIAKSLGIIGFNLVAFDASVDKNTKYAKVIGYEPTRSGNPSRFLRHRNRIISSAKDYKLTWFKRDCVTGAFCTLPK